MVTIPKRRRIGRWLLLIGTVLAIASWPLWLKVVTIDHRVWVTQSALYGIPYAVILLCVAINFLTPVAYGIATPLCWIGLVSAFFYGAMGFLTLETSFFAMAVVIPAHFLMTLGLFLSLRTPTGREVAQWFAGVVVAIAYAYSVVATRDTGRPPFPPTHGFSAFSERVICSQNRRAHKNLAHNLDARESRRACSAFLSVWTPTTLLQLL